MPTRTAVRTKNAPVPLPFFSQAIVCNGMVYCSGSIGIDPKTESIVESGVGDRTVSLFYAMSLACFAPIICNAILTIGYDRLGTSSA